MRERSVTRAATALHLGQEAVSAALGRLRRLFDDELFTRPRTGVEPAARAAEIARRIIRPSASATEPSPPPRIASIPPPRGRAFTLAMSDDLEAAVLPGRFSATADLTVLRITIRQANRITVGVGAPGWMTARRGIGRVR